MEIQYRALIRHNFLFSECLAAVFICRYRKIYIACSRRSLSSAHFGDFTKKIEESIFGVGKMRLVAYFVIDQENYNK